MSDQEIEQYARMGFDLGYNQPDAEPGIPLDEPWMSYYREGMRAGRQARAEADLQGAGADSQEGEPDPQYDGPAIGPDPGGESLEHYNRAYRELLELVLERGELHPEEKFPGEPPTVVEGTPGVE